MWPAGESPARTRGREYVCPAPNWLSPHAKETMEALVAPPTAIGWTHIWDYEEQLAISDEVASSLSFLGMITWSGDYKMYYPINGWNCQLIRERVLLPSHVTGV